MRKFCGLISCILLLAGFTACEKDHPVAKGHIALTFDDGPDSIYTARILDVLKEKNVKATFFVTGKHAHRYPQILVRMRMEGHLIGNHTYTHFYMPGASDSLLDYETDSTAWEIRRSGAGLPDLFRPPFGYITDTEKQHLHAKGYRIVLWDIDPLDYNLQRTPTPDDIADRVLLLRRDNAIVLMHSADYMDQQSRENTVLALPRIIDELRNKYNYDFITVKQVPGLQ